MRRRSREETQQPKHEKQHKKTSKMKKEEGSRKLIVFTLIYTVVTGCHIKGLTVNETVKRWTLTIGTVQRNML